jgi:hypothetical protein
METTIETASTIVAQSNILGLDAANRNAVPELLFQPKRLFDLKNESFQKNLCEFVKRNPDIDFVYKFNMPKHDPVHGELMKGHQNLSTLPDDIGKGLFIGGSSALHYMCEYIKGCNNVNWKAGDVDVFFLNCESNSRMAAPGSLDFIFCKDKTVEDVLLNFDLPCCRVGFDFKYNFYVSAQALVSIFTGKMYLPEYFSSDNDFMDKLNQFKDIKTTPSYQQAVTRMIVKRFYERVKKYQSRGFKVIYTHLDYILPWVRNRFTYIDFFAAQ